MHVRNFTGIQADFFGLKRAMTFVIGRLLVYETVLLLRNTMKT